MDTLTIINSQNFELVLKLIAALFLGMSLGVERAIAGKTAGMRTYGLVTMGATLFVVIGVISSGGYDSATGLSESTRLTANIISGIGFIGAGLMMVSGSKMSGVTTAAGIWVSAGIGMAVGYGLYVVAVTVTVLVLFVFTGLWYVENHLKTLTHTDHEE